MVRFCYFSSFAISKLQNFIILLDFAAFIALLCIVGGSFIFKEKGKNVDSSQLY